MRQHGGAKLWRSEIRTFLTALKEGCVFCYARLVRIRIEGREFWEKLHRKSCIVVANHVTGVDSVILQIALRRRLFMLAARRWFRNRFLAFVMTFFCDMVPVALEKGMKNLLGIKRTLALLRHRQSVGIYPSGEMYRNGLVPEIHNGAAYLAYKSGVPIVTVFVKNLALGPSRKKIEVGDDAVEGIGSFLKNIFNRKIEVFIAEPIYPRADVDRFMEMERINSEIRRSFDELIANAT